MQLTILRFESLDSTNTEAMNQVRNGADEGVCIVADEQTGGRGRLGREWSSPRGAGLYMSVVLRPELRREHLPLITFVAALGVCDALRKLHPLEVDIKYPNDVLIKEKKVCGILAEAIETRRGLAVIVGIGINLTTAALGFTLPNATAIEAEVPIKVNRESVLRAVLDGFQKWYAVLHEPHGSRRVCAEIGRQSSYVNGKRVRVTLDDKSFEGVSCGLESDGALRVRLASGDVTAVRAGDVTAVRAVR